MLFALVIVPLVAWVPLDYEDLIDSIPCDNHSLSIAFDTNVHVEAVSTYPFFAETDHLHLYVNEALQCDAQTRFDKYVQQLQDPQDDAEEDDLDRDLIFRYYPIYHSPNLISIYGYEYQYWCLPHGWFQHVGRTFWAKPDGSVKEVDFTDLFVGNATRFILDYANDRFRNCRYGYYSYEEQYWPDPLGATDLRAFVLLEKGLLLILPMYRVWGFGDGPDTLLIPYSDLQPIINPEGPIPVAM